MKHMVRPPSTLFKTNSQTLLQTDEVVQFKKIEALCDEYRELSYSAATDDVYKQSVMLTMLQKLELTDAELYKTQATRISYQQS